MNDTIEPIDIEVIMREIRDDIKRSGYTDAMLSFDDMELEDGNVHFETFDKENFRREVSDLNCRWQVQTYRNLGSGGLVGFAKKVIRKCIRFYVDPIVEDQNRFNASLVRTMNLMNCYIQEQDAAIFILKNQLERMEQSKDHEEVGE